MPVAEIVRATEAHRLAQARLAARTVTDMVSIWALLDTEDLDGTFPRWLRAGSALIGSRRVTSSTLAANYTALMRVLQLGATVAPALPVLAPPAPAKAVATSLLVTGPATIRSLLARGVQFATAVEQAKTSSARAASRHVLTGGRETVLGTVAGDRHAIGFARATSGKPCAFCAMLASRGPVYKDAASAGDGHKYHDGCHCTAVPVYRRDAPWPAGSRDHAELWKTATAGLSGVEASNAFRHALAAQAN